MSNGFINQEKNYIKYAIVILVIVLIVLGIFFVHEYRVVRHAQILGDIHRGVPLTVDDVDIIRPWMTFDYIDRIFNIPPAYLKMDLSITDPHYPGTSLSSYAQYSHTDVTLLTTQVEGAITTYLTNNVR